MTDKITKSCFFMNINFFNYSVQNSKSIISSILILIILIRKDDPGFIAGATLKCNLGSNLELQNLGSFDLS